MSDKATPCPWYVNEKHRAYMVDRGGTVIGTMSGPDKGANRANADACVRAVNNFDALLAALERIVAAWESIPPKDQVNEEMNLDGMWANAKTAIANAKE